MTDAEAEAVLLALGGVLRWADGILDDIEARTDKGDYSITRQTRRHVSGTYHAYNVRWCDWDAEKWEEGDHLMFTSEKSAKAACERHYLTGKWE